MDPLFVPGLPGGPELLIVLLMFVVYFLVPVLGVVAIYNFLDGKRGYEERITSLERRVEELEDDRA